MVCDGVLDDLHELCAAGALGCDGHGVQQLNHQPGEARIHSGDPCLGVDLDQHIFGRVDKDLKAKNEERRKGRKKGEKGVKKSEMGEMGGGEEER